jgi:MEMO1 family protein
MTTLVRPRVRLLDVIELPQNDGLKIVLRDPEGFGRTVVLPFGAALAVSFMDGQHTGAEIRQAFKTQTDVPLALNDLERLIAQLDEAYLLDNRRFQRYRDEQIERYLASPVRPAAHAGDAYAADADELREQLAGLFAELPVEPSPEGAQQTGELCAMVAPHIDFARGGPLFAQAYRQIEEHSNADLFVIFGTAHGGLENYFSITRKDFETPLGLVRTDSDFIDRLTQHLGSSLAGQQIDLAAGELAHRHEHSIEFQTVFLQYVLGGKREFRIVPVLVGSFAEFIGDGLQPDDSPEIASFLAALAAAAADYPGRICYLSAADLAHIGPRFGDRDPLDKERLAEQAQDDRRLLDAVCRVDTAALFRHVADQQDRSRICGLPPTWTMLEAARPSRGELLDYHQAVDPEGLTCVSFASLAFYR